MIVSYVNKQRNAIKKRGGWGLDRIRTDVDGFADHCLATRPRDLNYKITKVQLPINNTTYSSTITATYFTSPSIGGLIFWISTLQLSITLNLAFSVLMIR